MTSTVIFNDFKSPKFWRSRFRRSEYELWDANVHHGDVRPFRCPEIMCGDQSLQIYSLPECECHGFAQRTPVSKGFCRDQHFFIREGILRHHTTNGFCNNTDEDRFAGAPVPNQFIFQDVQSDCQGCDATGVSYVITNVIEHAGIQIESAPSIPTEVIATGGHIPNVTLTLQGLTALETNYSIVVRRIYRVETTFEDGTDSMSPHGAEFVFVAEVDPALVQFIDDVPSSETGGPLTTYEPMAFPAPLGGSLIALTRTLDGIAVAERNRVYISVPGQPQFTLDGVVEIEDDIEEIVAINDTIFVFTNNKPVKLGYRHTDGVMSIDKQVIERRLPLKSWQSVSVYDSKVFFSTTHSLYSWDIGGYGSDIGSSLTPMLTPEQWLNIDPETVKGTAYEFGYIFSSDNLNHSLMVQFETDRTDITGDAAIVPISYINDVRAFGLDNDGHILFTDGQGMKRWDWRRPVDAPIELHDNLIPNNQDICDCCPWTIKMYFDNEGKNRFSKMRIEWDERSAAELTANFYHFAFGREELIDGPLSVISSRGFSIPKFCSSQTFCVEVSGCGIMHEIRLATSMQELVSNSNNLKGNTQE